MATSEDIEKLVLEYQSGIEENALVVLDLLEPYMKKFMDLLKYRRYRRDETDIKLFVKLFSGKNASNDTIQKRLYTLSKQCETIGFEDIEQEIKMLVIYHMQRYKKNNTGGTFLGYLYNAFPYALYRKLRSYIKDPLVFICDNMINLSTPETIIGPLDCLFFEDEYSLGENWINGLLCDRPFLKLTDTERAILKLCYIEKMSDADTGKELGLNKRQVFYRRQRAEECLAEELGEHFVAALKAKRARKRKF